MEWTENPQPPGAPDPPPRRKSNLGLAVLPALLISTGMSTWSILKFAGVRPALGVFAKSDSPAQKCAHVYGLTLASSEYYVRESIPGSGIAAHNAPRELSTVIKGMVENTCDQPLSRVRIAIEVRDASGKRGSSEAVIGKLRPHEAKHFERAWMANITSYEITGIH